MVRGIVFLIAVHLCNGIVQAQLPKAVEMQVENVFVKLSNIELVTGSGLMQDERGTRPLNPLPLVANQLYPPNTIVFLKFDFETDLQLSHGPKEIKLLALSLEIPLKTKSSIGGFMGVMPAVLGGGKGTSYIGISQLFTDEKTKLAEIETKLQLYGQRNDNTPVPAVTSKEKIEFEIKMDRLAQITETELKELYKRLQELEARVNRLEASRGK